MGEGGIPEDVARRVVKQVALPPTHLMDDVKPFAMLFGADYEDWFGVESQVSTDKA